MGRQTQQKPRPPRRPEPQPDTRTPSGTRLPY
jgi:hypothetical protein